MSNVVSIESKSSLAKLMATEDIAVEHKNVSTASFDVKRRVLTLPKWEKMSSTIYDGLIAHEIGHALFTPFEGWKNAVEKKTGFQSFLNVVEDARIERKVRIKYPGMNKGFHSLYSELMDRDFFGLSSSDINDYPLIDRINVHFKAGFRAGVEFTEEEDLLVDMVEEAETWEEVVTAAETIYEYAKGEQNEMDLVDPVDLSDDFEFEDGEDGEETGETMTTPMPPQSGPEEGEESESGESSSEEGEESESGESSGEESEESEKGSSGSSSASEGVSENESSDEDTSGEGTEGEESEEYSPQSHTQDTFDKTVESMSQDDNGRESIYIALPESSEKRVVQPFKSVLSELHTFYTDETNNSKSTIELYANSFNKFKKESIPTVNYLVKEFEMKKAADAHTRTNISKSGVLDTNKMHSYKINDDIFRRMETIRDGKNHGLLMYVDWSGSMCSNIFGTIKQTLNLVMFARKVGIPFEVYAFSNRGQVTMDHGWDSTTINEPTLAGSKFKLIQFFHHNMNTKQFNAMCKYFYFLGAMLDNTGLEGVGWHYSSSPSDYSLGSTPLNEAIITSIDQVERFKRETGSDKVHAIFLTDGASDSNTDYYDPSSENDYPKSTWGQDVFLRDTKTKVTRKLDRYNITDDLLGFLRERTDAEAIGFFILPNPKAMTRWKSWDKVADGRKEMRKDGFTTADGTGYSDFYLIKGGKGLDTSSEELTIDPTAKRGAMTTAFRKFSKGKRVNKVLLSRFVDMVA